MGQSHSDEKKLLLSSPHNVKYGNQGIMAPGVSKCTLCKAAFSRLCCQKKQYCRRCGIIICEECSAMRQYKSAARLFRVCTVCATEQHLGKLLAQNSAWESVLVFLDEVEINTVMSASKAFLYAIPLPFRTVKDWKAVFADGKFLAAGANGSVYRTKQRDDGREVAVKVIDKKRVHVMRKWRHILREIHALQHCAHKCVVPLVDVLQTREKVFVVLEYAQGGDLFDWLVARRGVPSEQDVKQLARDLMLTVHFMHYDRGSVHRDIKPENILLRQKQVGNETPQIWLADFGFARVLTPSTSSDPEHGIVTPITSLRMVVEPLPQHIASTPCGTLGFAPPEVIVAYNKKKELPETPAPVTSHEMARKMDIFAAGVTIAILLTGCEPFPCHSSKAHLQSVRGGIQFVGRQWASVGREAKALLRWMLQLRPEGRPTAIEVLKSPWFVHATIPMSMPQAMAEAPDDQKEFAESIKSLRKNDGLVLVQDDDGTIRSVTRREREGGEIRKEARAPVPGFRSPALPGRKSASPVPSNATPLTRTPRFTATYHTSEGGKVSSASQSADLRPIRGDQTLDTLSQALLPPSLMSAYGIAPDGGPTGTNSDSNQTPIQKPCDSTRSIDSSDRLFYD